MNDLYSLFYMLEANGVYQFILPFLLVFVIVFAILEKTRIFSAGSSDAPKSNINAVVAIIIALLLIVQTDLVLFMQAYLSRMALFMIIGIMFMLVVSMLVGTKDNSKFEGFGLVAGVIIAVIALLWSLSSGMYGAAFPYWFYISESVISTLLLVGAIVVVIGIVVKGGNSSSKDKKKYLTLSN